ncbi:hypothetical protein ACTVMZ_23485, partial [Serratia ureilytica]
MDADLISYESMLIARDSANWAYWSMIAAYGSAIVSLLTFVLAFFALNAWKQQEKLKVKKEFKTSLIRLKHLLLYMPDKIDSLKLRQGLRIISQRQASYLVNLSPMEFEQLKDYALDCQTFEDGVKKCRESWVATENLLSETKVGQLWQKTSGACD